MSEKHYDEVLGWNIIKNQKNKTVSDLKPDDKVRIRIDGAFTKGTEPRWSEDVYDVKKVNGTTITLTNDKRYKRTNLLKVAVTSKGINNVVSEASKQNKQKQLLQREDIVINNIVARAKRTIKKPSRYKD